MIVSVLAQIVRGFLMGSADVVPGVSGGTVALVLGIYRRLVDTIGTGSRALGRLARLDVPGFVRGVRAIDRWFLVPLLGGIGMAILTLAHVIETALEDHPIRMAGLFFGLVVGSTIVASRMVTTRDPTRVAVFAGVAVVTFLVLGLRASEVADPGLIFVFVSGSLAICAMILPGISGSFILLMMGMYAPVLRAVNERDLVVVAVFGVGAVVGLAVFSRLLQYLLVSHEQTMLAALIGLMLGSLRAIWPWPEGTAGTRMTWPQGDVVVPVVLAGVGMVAVVGISWIARSREAAEPATAG